MKSRYDKNHNLRFMFSPVQEFIEAGTFSSSSSDLNEVHFLLGRAAQEKMYRQKSRDTYHLKSYTVIL